MSVKKHKKNRGQRNQNGLEKRNHVAQNKPNEVRDHQANKVQASKMQEHKELHVHSEHGLSKIESRSKGLLGTIKKLWK